MTMTPVRYRFSVEEYEEMGRAGILAPEDRVELVDGEILERPLISSRHAACVRRVEQRLGQVGQGIYVQVQMPLRLPPRSGPEPDVAVVVARPDFYAERHPEPAEVVLVVEVAVSSLASDRRRKRPIYAAAGIVETWIVDVEAGRVEVATEPGPDGYQAIALVEVGGTITPQAFPDRSVAVGDLLP